MQGKLKKLKSSKKSSDVVGKQLSKRIANNKEDGTDFKLAAKLSSADMGKQTRRIKATFKKQNAKYIKVVAKNAGKIASGKPGAGEDCWLFCDEININ